MTLTNLEKALADNDIRESMARYLMGVDRLDANLIESAFHKDAVIDHAGFIWSGSEIGEVLVSAISTMFDRSMHLLGNQFIEFVGEYAFSESYVLAHCVLPIPDDDTLIFRSLRYVDRFEKRDGRWRIQARRTVREWDRLEKPLAPTQELPSNGPTQDRERLKADYIAANGFWPEAHEALLELDPDFLRAYLNLSNQASARGALEPKVREFIAIAMDASATHPYNTGTRNHIRQALRLGATRDEVLEVLEIVSLIGIRTTTDAMPMLREEVRAIEKETR